MRILAIETSCDETAVCIVESDDGASFRILGDALFSQAALHAPYGGVFPNLAKREHQKNLVPLLQKALADSEQLTAHSHVANTVSCQLSAVGSILSRETELLPHIEQFLQTYEKPNVDAIAVTTGPGLEPALWVGVNFAKALAAAWGLPLVAVNHMEGHVIASLVSKQQTAYSLQPSQGFPVSCQLSAVSFPAVALLVSGGHTELQLVHSIGQYELLGATRDDAAGECFDKSARLLGLPYPGGPEISRLAADARARGLIAPGALPRPMLESGDYDFSFSGLKTAVRKLVESSQPLTDDVRAAIAMEVEDAIVETLITKTMRAAEEYNASTIIVGGGVAANRFLRTQFEKIRRSDLRILFPAAGLSTDNAVMIALAGWFRAQKGEYADAATLRVDGNMRLS